MAQFKTLISQVMPLPVNDIDTDQIIPAQFLKVTDKNGLADALFYHWRYTDDKSPKAEFILNQPEYKDAQILLAGDNFGCGSSREHAPWALTSYGFRAVISTSFADIFRNNATKTGLVPVVVTPEFGEELLRRVECDPALVISIDIAERRLSVPAAGLTCEFPLDDFTQYRLLEGLDDIGLTLRHADKIAAYESRRPAWMPSVR